MNTTYLIDHFSYSSLSCFCNNRYKFLLTYVLKTFSFKSGPSALVGKAFHIAVERILKGMPTEDSIEFGLQHIATVPDSQVKWGKTGSREVAMKTYTQTINAFLAEYPDMGDTIMVEEALTEFIKPIPEFSNLAGASFGIPLKCVPDHVTDRNQDLEIDDWKTVISFSDPEIEKPKFIMQALCNFHPVWVKTGRRPKRMNFWEVKTGTNKDGSPQVRKITYEFDSPEMLTYFSVFYRIYDACSVEVSKEDVLFIPNFSDMFDGEETFKMFAGETVGIDRPKAVAHKIAEATIQDRNYTPSAPDAVDNKFVPEEEKIRMKLQEFGIAVEMNETLQGLNVTRYTMKPSRGVRMKQFEAHAKDIALALKAQTVRIEAPIPGTNLVGIEVPAAERRFVNIPEDMVRLTDEAGKLIIPLGVDVYGKIQTMDLAEAPHMLVAGATGSGKSVFLNVLIHSLIQQNPVQGLKFVLIDPKRVELAAWKNSEYLLAKPIYEIDEAMKTLSWLVEEMEYRYEKLEKGGFRNIDERNNAIPDRMEKIVVVVDEFGDLILQSKQKKSAKGRKSKKTEIISRGKKVTIKENDGEELGAEDLIVRLAQKARAVGIHLVLGTQRPSVNVVTGLIKANVPMRVAFSTVSEIDSRIILDQSGAEALLGKGDMLVMAPGVRGLTRLQGFNI